MKQIRLLKRSRYIIHSPPFLEMHRATIKNILSNNGDDGPEFCRRSDQHPYELVLQIEGASNIKPLKSGDHRAMALSQESIEGMQKHGEKYLKHSNRVAQATWSELPERQKRQLNLRAK